MLLESISSERLIWLTGRADRGPTPLERRCNAIEIAFKRLRSRFAPAQNDSFLKIRSGTSLIMVMMSHQNPGV